MARSFYKIECDECGNRQTIFSRTSTEVECLVCSETLAKPTGGKPELNAEILEELSVN